MCCVRTPIYSRGSWEKVSSGRVSRIFFEINFALKTKVVFISEAWPFLTYKLGAFTHQSPFCHPHDLPPPLEKSLSQNLHKQTSEE
jgi:hypothetical protein